MFVQDSVRSNTNLRDVHVLSLGTGKIFYMLFWYCLKKGL
jgi:hypothetical protein